MDGELSKGFIERHTRDPMSFDSAEAYKNAFREHEYWLAKGDQRGNVALDHRGEVYTLLRMTSAKTKGPKARLGNPAKPPSVDDTEAWIAERHSPSQASRRASQSA